MADDDSDYEAQLAALEAMSDDGDVSSLGDQDLRLAEEKKYHPMEAIRSIDCVNSETNEVIPGMLGDPEVSEDLKFELDFKLPMLIAHKEVTQTSLSKKKMDLKEYVALIKESLQVNKDLQSTAIAENASEKTKHRIALRIEKLETEINNFETYFEEKKLGVIEEGDEEEEYESDEEVKVPEPENLVLWEEQNYHAATYFFTMDTMKAELRITVGLNSLFSGNREMVEYLAEKLETLDRQLFKLEKGVETMTQSMESYIQTLRYSEDIHKDLLAKAKDKKTTEKTQSRIAHRIKIIRAETHTRENPTPSPENHQLPDDSPEKLPGRDAK
jgi:hypothetical protein